jgi:hypothetical protein
VGSWLTNEFYLNATLVIFNGEKLNSPFYLNGINTFEPYLNYENNSTDLFDWIKRSKRILLKKMADLNWDKTFRPLIFEHWIYGVHLVDAIFKARVSFQYNNWWTETILTSVGNLEFPKVEESEVVNKVLEFMKMMVDESEGLIYIGLQVLSSPLNIAVNLYGPKFLETIALEPQKAQHDLQVITETIIMLHIKLTNLVPKSLLKPFWATGRFMPKGYGIIDGCTTQLISNMMYEEFISELDNRILDCYPNGGMIHICGNSKHQIPVFKKMNALKAIQLNDRATDDFESYYNNLRQDQIIYVVPNEKIIPDNILRISDGGKRVIINSDDNMGVKNNE